MRSSRTIGVARLVTSLLPVLVGLGASTVLAVDYVRPAPVFCTEGGGCDALKHTVFAALLGVPTPFLGLAGFAALGVFALASGSVARTVEWVLAAFAAVAGLALFAVQVRLGHFCPFCCAADASAVGALLVATGRLVRAPDAEPSRAAVLTATACLAIAVASPLLASARMTPEVPAAIRAEIESAPRGSVAIVDFVDFECPFCRMTDEQFEPILAAHKAQVHLVRRQVPLRMHPHAMDAARAACCGEQLGQGDAMADALFRTDVSELTPEGCERVATRVGVPLSAYRACIADPKTDERIEADRREFKAARGFALPTIWIGKVELVGAKSSDDLAKALERALARAGS